MISFVGTQCADAYNITLGTISYALYPELEGVYTWSCADENGWPIYQQAEGSYVLFYVSSSQYWLISEKVSTSTAPLLLRYMAQIGDFCPDYESTSAPWYVVEVSL